MKPTKEQLASPKWWKDSVDDKHDFAYTTGSDWDGLLSCEDTIEFADDQGWFDNESHLCIEEKSWVLLCERPVESIGFIPEAWKPCEVLNKKLNNPEWEKCTPLFVGEYSIVYDSETCKERTGCLALCEFRPLKTERELLVENLFKMESPSLNQILDAINSDTLERLYNDIYDARIVEGE